MIAINYFKFNEVTESDFLHLLNNSKIREHLIEHELYTAETLKIWVNSKIGIDGLAGCKVRAIIFEEKLVGWCGIQPEEEKYEMAIIIDEKFWGLGRQVFKDVMRWARELEHKEIFIHFLNTRPKYKFLEKMATHVYEANLLGNKFTTYQLTVK